MSGLSDVDALLALRRSPRYRVAVWVARLANVVAFAVLGWGVAMSLDLVPDLSSGAWFLVMLAAVAVLCAASALFYRAGVRAGNFGLVAETLARDVFGPRV